MFQKADGQGYRLALEGIEQKTLVFGERTLLAEFHLAAGSVLPRHAHPYEQTGYLVSGRLRMHIGSDSFVAAPGDSWSIPADVEHGADIMEDAVAVEVFSPVREDYLPERS